jgi:tRNA threonylcarbamoyladenosine biosynthesis protein TsaB
VSSAILALDASAAACSVALAHEGRIAAWREAAMDRGHAEALMPLVMDVMTEAEMGFDDLTTIAVGVGPGSFTGIRIAIAAARGIGLAAHRPVAGIDSFSAVAAAITAGERVGRSLLVVIESRRTELFGQYFDAELRVLGEPMVLPAEALLHHRPPGVLLIAGDGARHLPDGADITRASDAGRPGARAIARLAGAGRCILAARPLYLRPADVSLPKPRSETNR